MSDHRLEHSLVLITPPTQDVITLDEAKAQLRVTDDTQDDLVTAIVTASAAQLDPAGGGWLGRALRPQTWELRLPGFYQGRGDYEESFHQYRSGSRAELELPYPPVTQIVSVKYDDINGVEQTLVEGTDFRVLNSGGLGKQAIAPLYNMFWPVARWDAETVRIRFTAGYDADADPDTLPNPIKQAVLLGVRHIYSVGERSLFQSGQDITGLINNSWVVSEASGNVIREATESLLSTYRVF